MQGDVEASHVFNPGGYKMRKNILSMALAVAFLLTVGAFAQTVDWKAHNDCVGPASGSAANVTHYSGYLGGGGGFEDPDGYLKNYDTGADLPVYVTLEAVNVAGSLGGMPNAGTDAYNAFNGIVNLNESASYNSSSTDWSYKVTFTGLDPNKTYEFVTTANRNSSSYAGSGTGSRWAKFSIIEAEAYTNASSSGSGVIVVSQDVIKMNTGYNTVEGNVVKWTGIRSGSDGSFVVLSQNVGSDGPGEPIKSYGLQGFVLTQSSGPTLGGTVTVKLLDSNNSGLTGGDVYYYKSGWQLLGTTDGSGTVSGNVPVTSTTDIEIRYIGGKYKWVGVNVTTNPTLTISTVPVTVKLETCNSTPLVGEAKYYYGGWITFGGGSTPATMELLPYSGLGPGVGSYDFQVKYGGRTSTTIRQDISVDPNIIFKTTKVDIAFNGNIYYYNSGWQLFPIPLEMVGTSVDFKFGALNNPTVTLNFSGCSLTKSYVLLAVKDENNNGVSGGKATPAYGGSWGATLSGQTDANGKLFSEIPPGYTKIKMAVNQGGAEQTVAQLTASNYTWTTQILRIWLKDHNGSAITDGQGSLDQGGGYWYSWGNLNASGYRDLQLFAGNYKFKMTYNYTSQEKFPVVTVNAGIDNFDFQTGQVISSCGHTQYSTGAWRTFTSGMELMPGTYTFRYPSQSGTVVAGTITTLCVNVNSSIKAIIGSTNYYDSGSNQVRADIAIKNISSAPIYGPLISKFKTLTPGPPTITIPNADGGGNGIGCYYDYSNLLGGDNQLDPGETTGYKLWIFQENVKPPVNFKFFADVFGHLDGISKAADSNQEQPLAFLFDVQRGAVEENSVAAQPGNGSEIPETYALHQNHPNPFNPTTTLQFDLPEAGNVTLKIYNSVGQLVRTLVSGEYEAGAHNVIWDARNDSDVQIASGVYLAVFKAGGVQQVRRLVLMK
jgi:FlgD Ig-like domain